MGGFIIFCFGKPRFLLSFMNLIKFDTQRSGLPDEMQIPNRSFVFFFISFKIVQFFPFSLVNLLKILWFFYKFIEIVYLDDKTLK